jgi:hypothetical protein
VGFEIWGIIVEYLKIGAGKRPWSGTCNLIYKHGNPEL